MVSKTLNEDKCSEVIGLMNGVILLGVCSGATVIGNVYDLMRTYLPLVKYDTGY